ncbi:MAG TPA: SDR family oxidoreductase [Clostridia bacterium]|nr:SDR family oxidoreductase [Clostridia bacterium]
MPQLETDTKSKSPESPTPFDLQKLTAMYDFTGQTVVVTGGAGILGGDIACALVGCGAQVAILDLNLESGKALLERMGERASQAELFACNVLQTESLNKAAAEVKARFGKIDCVINAAGGNKPQATTGADLKFFDLPTDALRWVFDLNILGTILPCQIFGKVMAEQGHGTILNVSSMNAFRPLTRIPAYSAAKAGVSNFTQWLAVHMAQEYSPRIRVNAIAPGFFLTNQNRFLLTDRETGGLTPRGKSIISHTPMARFGEPEDLFGAVLWLLSPASSFVTGSVIAVDGGFAAYSGV